MTRKPDGVRHGPGRGHCLTQDERREIQWAALTEGASVSAIARRFGRRRETVASCLKGADFEELAVTVRAAAHAKAREVLERHIGDAAAGWGRAVTIAADKGDHRPAKDLLLATRVVEPPREEVRQSVTIVVGMPGAPAGQPPVVDVVPRLPPSDGEDGLTDK